MGQPLFTQSEEREARREARRSCFSQQGWEYCDLSPWLNEITMRMHEAAAAGTDLVNLSHTHPRGYIPNQIVRRPKVRELLKGWRWDNSKNGANGFAPETYWLPKPDIDLESCRLDPFVKEIERREKEAQGAGQPVDLSTLHPRGGIPSVILKRIGQKSDRRWREDIEAQVMKLRGDANRAAALAKTLHDKMEAVDDPRKLKAASRDQARLADDLRAEAARLEKELA